MTDLPETQTEVRLASRMAIVGHRGFVGSAITRRLANRAGGSPGQAGQAEPGVIAVLIDRVDLPEKPDPTASPEEVVLAWIDEQPSSYDRLVQQLSGTDAIINAAGLALPDEQDLSALWSANCLLPVVLTLAAADAGVPRLVHLSTAGVQGFNKTLDESTNTFPFSSYTSSKAAAEDALGRLRARTAVEVVVYRPTSVQGVGRKTTTSLAHFLRRRIVPVLAGAARPVPLALVENVAALAIHLASTDTPSEVVLHPSEGITTKNLIELMGGKRTVSVPIPGLFVVLLKSISRVIPRLGGPIRRVCLFLEGQEILSSAASTGFTLPVGHERYRELAKEAAP